MITASKRYSFFGLVTFFAAWVYARTLSYGFVFDDLPTILNNNAVKFLDVNSFIMHHGRWISVIWNKWTYQNWGPSPIAFRLGNAVLYLLLAYIIFELFYILLRSLPINSFARAYANAISVMMSLLFLLHPAQTQTSLYIVQMRLEGLALLVILCTIFCFVKGSKAIDEHSAHGYSATTWYWYGAATIIAVVGAGSKEIVIILPAMMLLVDLFFLSHFTWAKFKRTLPAHVIISGTFLVGFFLLQQCFSVSSVFTLNTALINNRGNLLTPSYDDPIKPIPYLFTQFGVLVHYLRIFFWPTQLSFDYDWSIVNDLLSFEVLRPLALLLMLGAFTLYLLKKLGTNTFTFGIWWFFIAMAPRATIIPSTELVSDYKTFPASVGILLILATCIIWFFVHFYDYAHTAWTRRRAHLIVFSTELACMLAICNLNINTGLMWSDSLEFWQNSVNHAPKKARGWNNLGAAHSVNGNTEKALACFRQAIECDANYAEPLINLGSHYQICGETTRAMEYYDKAIANEREPHAECYNNAGLIWYGRKNYAKAEEYFKTAILLNKYYGKAHFNLARVYYAQAMFEKTYEHAVAALTDFKEPMGMMLYGKAAYQTQRYNEAVKGLTEGLKDCEEIDARFMLGCTQYALMNYSEAKVHFEKIHEREPSNTIYCYNLAQTMLNLNEYARAIPLFEQCSKSPDFPFASLHIVRCLEKNGNKGDAAIRWLKLMSDPTVAIHVKREGEELGRTFRYC